MLAGVAAFQLSLPDRKPSWVLLPLPAVALWIGASATGCFRSWTAMSGGPLTLGGTDHCLLFILGVSMPLSIIFVVMLRSGYSLRPNLTSISLWVASAAAAATLLNFIHVHDETASDIAVHAFAVSTVILANRIFGNWFLMTNTFEARRNKNSNQLELTSTALFKLTPRTPHDWIDNVKVTAPEYWPASTGPARTDYQGHVIRLHRPGGDGS